MVREFARFNFPLPAAAPALQSLQCSAVGSAAASCCTQYCILCPFQPWNFCSRNCSFHEGHGERHHPSNLAPSKLETYHQVSELVTWKGCFIEAKKLVAFVRLQSGYVENLLSVTINFSFYGRFFQLVTSRSYKYCQCRHLCP